MSGREEDQRSLMELVLPEESAPSSSSSDDDDAGSDNNVGVIPVVGMGGVGKTTLVQLLYNSEEVQHQFDLRAWVSVREDFNVFVSKATQSILMTIKSNVYDVQNVIELQIELQRVLTGKKFLLVVDNLWSDDPSSWRNFLTPLLSGAKGSKVVVTTRNQSVASLVGTIPSYNLNGELSLDDSWNLFLRHAFGKKNCNLPPNLEETGREIVRYCRGVPLVIKILGRLMRGRRSDVMEWENILQELMHSSEDHDVLRILKFCYDRLPLQLQHCFAFCGRLPPNYTFAKEEIVRLWVAEGVVKKQPEKSKAEGDECFDQLLELLFFQQVRRHPYPCFGMHDLIRDLAIHVSQELFQQQSSRSVQAESSFDSDKVVASDGKGNRKVTKLEWMLVLINVVLETLLVTFDQISTPHKPQYGLIALLVSLTTLSVCVTELVHKGRRQNRRGMKYWIRHPTSDDNPYNFVDIFSISAAISQVVFSSIAYKFLCRGRENPVKVSFSSIIFIVCFACSRFVNKPTEPALPVSGHDI